MALIRAFQSGVKNFCEDQNQSERDDLSTYRGIPSITFFNRETRKCVVFDRETKLFITTYIISERNFPRFLETHELGKISD